SSQSSYGNIWIYGGFGNDLFTATPQIIGASTQAIIFHGDQGTDTANVDGSTLTTAQYFTLLGNTVQRSIPGNPFVSETQFDATVENINIKGGSGNDTFQILSVSAGQ